VRTFAAIAALVGSTGALAQETARLVVPVEGVRREALTDTWGQSRAGGARAHEAIDIMARRGTPVLAAADGTVEMLFQSARGGITVYVRSPDRRRIYYYAHLDRYAPGLAERQRVGAGDMLGFVGSTGDASPEAPHLHFAIELVEPGEGWWQGRAINPYPLLRR
jgi:murein DD-endopeptidase MepM/ murein hydrolase activator NlpD